jgi:hypothetical protein
MAAVANNPKFAKKVGVSKSVGEEFMKADKPKKMAMGGMHKDVKMDKKVVKKAVGMHEKQLHSGKKSNLSKLAKGGGIEVRGKTKGTMVKMRKGGSC